MSEQDRQTPDQNATKKEETENKVKSRSPQFQGKLSPPPTTGKLSLPPPSESPVLRQPIVIPGVIRRSRLKNNDEISGWVNNRSFFVILIFTAVMLVVSILFVVIALITKTNQFDLLLDILSAIIIVFSLLIFIIRFKPRKSLNI